MAGAWERYRGTGRLIWRRVRIMTARQSDEPTSGKSMMHRWMDDVEDQLAALRKAQFRNTILLVIAVTTGLINVGMAMAKASSLTFGLSGVVPTLLKVFVMGVIK